ncbi:MAG TPA: hypothetical protein VFH59_04510 [Frateuria sp.]|uniref:hypothetical protein n=1 Tax=Frateuria sp. TaxID=2211372 RepID=UPI002D7F14DA|nr:hypothetical protein [Frateuria sp.]HET6804688.1 hypothetical protein [Frateuria sp.]
MRAIAQLWLLPCRQMPLLGILAHLLWMAALACLVWMTPHPADAALGAGLLAMGSWFWHLGLATTLRGACQPETFLLPAFRRRLAAFGLLDALAWVGLPAMLALARGVPHVPLGAALLLLAGAMGFAMGVERWVSLLFWPLLVLAGWMPGLAGVIVQDALNSPLTLPLLLLVAALLLRVALRPMLQVADRPPDASPLEGIALGRNVGTGTAPRRSALGQRIEGWFDAIAQQAMDRALARYREQPSASRRRTLVRRLLLPHDNAAAIGLRIAIMAVFATLYVVVALHRQHFNATVVGAYAVLIALARFPQIGRGMQRMRPNLADLYLTLAPTTRTEYQQTLADALLVLVPIGTLTAVAYTALGIVLTHATQPGLMLLVTLVVATGGGLVALAVHLVGPQHAVGRQLVNAAVLMGTMAVYWGGVWLVDTLGYGFGGGLLALVTLGFGLGAWFAAQREYQRRAPCFETPLA